MDTEQPPSPPPPDIRKERFFTVIAGVSIPVILLFCLLDIQTGNVTGFFISLAILVIVLGCLIGVKKGFHRITYFTGGSLLGAVFLFNIGISAGGSTSLFWIFMLPMIYFIFLGLRTGGILLGLLSLILIILLLRPDLTDAHVYEPYLITRFLITFAFVIILSWLFESENSRYERQLTRQRDRIKKQKDFLEKLLETLPSPVFFKDTRGRYLGCNKAFESFIRQSRSDIIGRTVHDMNPGETADIYHKKDTALFNSPGRQVYEGEVVLPGDERRQVIFSKSTFADESGRVQGLIGAITDITALKLAEGEKENLIRELESALGEIKTLSGMLPICSSCKKIRDDKGYWNRIETYIERHSQALFSHSLCPECTRDIYGDEPWFKDLENG